METYAAEMETALKQGDFTGDEPTSISLVSNESEPVISGTWQTASIGYEADGKMQPEYYVQFSDSEIIYGHMEKNYFIPEYFDSISQFEEMAEGGYIIQAESENGVQYTYKSAEGDENILEYYATWTTKNFQRNTAAVHLLANVNNGEIVATDSKQR